MLKDIKYTPWRWLWGLFSISALMFVFIFSSLYSECGDNMFLYNRIWNMAECLKEGNLPWIYYKDLSGLGYGNSFFYPDLTLWFFVPLIFIGINKDIIIGIYWCLTILLNYLGLVFLCKRFTKNYVEIASIVLLSPVYISATILFNLPACTMAHAFLYVFLALAVDFFRDNKSFIPVTAVLFFIINTNLVTALMGVIYCALLLVFYFNKKRWKEYIYFICLSAIVSSYIIVNIIYHSDFDMVLGHFNEFGMDSVFYLSKIPVSNIALYLTIDNIAHDGIRLFELGTLLIMVGVLAYRIQRKKISKREIVAILIVILVYIFSIKDIFQMTLAKFKPTAFIYPVRYILVMATVCTLICLRYIKKRIILIASMILSFITCLGVVFIIGTGSTEEGSGIYTDSGILFEHVYITGDYLKNGMDLNINEMVEKSNVVIDQNGTEYSWTEKEGVIRVAVPNDMTKRVLRFPKLYYKGYTCTSYGKEFNITMDESQFIVVDIGTSGGEIVLQYKHPIGLVILWFLVLFTECFLWFMVIRNNKKLLKNFYKKLQKVNPFKVY